MRYIPFAAKKLKVSACYREGMLARQLPQTLQCSFGRFAPHIAGKLRIRSKPNNLFFHLPPSCDSSTSRVTVLDPIVAKYLKRYPSRQPLLIRQSLPMHMTARTRKRTSVVALSARQVDAPNLVIATSSGVVQGLQPAVLRDSKILASLKVSRYRLRRPSEHGESLERCGEFSISSHDGSTSRKARRSTAQECAEHSSSTGSPERSAGSAVRLAVVSRRLSDACRAHLWSGCSTQETAQSSFGHHVWRHTHSSVSGCSHLPTVESAMAGEDCWQRFRGARSASVEYIASRARPDSPQCPHARPGGRPESL